VFVASGYIDGARPFWWDELEALLLRPGRMPPNVAVDVGGETLRWELGGDAVYSNGDMAERGRWNLLEPDGAGPRQALYRELCRRLRPLEHTERERALESLRSVAEPAERHDEPPRPLTGDEVALLADGGGLVEVGAHTVTHPVLSRLPEGRQQEEVAGSKRALEELIGRPVESFAYPYGGPGDVDETTVSVVRRTGFLRACATEGGESRRARRDPFRVPRLVVRNWSAAELECRLLGATP
jgi:peptidoglycan/xylan/chitin deacetylase (PgdA/CDA1 family)